MALPLFGSCVMEGCSKNESRVGGEGGSSQAALWWVEFVGISTCSLILLSKAIERSSHSCDPRPTVLDHSVSSCPAKGAE